MKTRFQLDHFLAELVGVFLDRAQMGTALLTVHRLRSLMEFRRFYKKS